MHGEVSDTLRTHARRRGRRQGGRDRRHPCGSHRPDVHEATIAVIRQHGFAIGLPADDAPDTYCAMVHGTGHGVGLEVHEPPLLDKGGPVLVVGDAVTVEPGLYCKAIGGVRLEDLVVVTDDGCENLNRLPEELTGRDSRRELASRLLVRLCTLPCIIGQLGRI